MEDLLEQPNDYGCYIVDRRSQSVEDSVEALVSRIDGLRVEPAEANAHRARQTNTLLGFVTKTRRQRINQRNRTERVSELLDWKSLGNEYIKARQLALRRAYPESFDDDEPDFTGMPRIGAPLSAPGSPRFKSGMMTPGDLGESITRRSVLASLTSTSLRHLDGRDGASRNSRLHGSAQ